MFDVSSSGLQRKDFLKFSVDCTHARPFSAFDWWYHYKQGPTHQYVCRELSQDRHVVGNPITRLMVPLTNNFTSVALVHSIDGTTSTTLKPSTWQLEFGGDTLGCLHSIIEQTNQSSGHSRTLHRCALLMCSSHQKAVAKKPNLGTSKYLTLYLSLF